MFSENPFISYSQNFEDVILWRLLAHVDSGFYIDLGAQHPIYDSVTHAFYERGWSGINVEPNLDFLNLLNISRPRDINLGCLVGSGPGAAKFFRAMDASGLSTGVLEFAKNLESSATPLEIETKEVRPLSEICETYVKGDIHFLKIDVEGMEREVILGADFETFRPWIVVVEAFQPNSRIESHGEWENLLINSHYEMAYADGLNRFYLAKEKSGLKKGFEFPPNIFDNFKMLAVADRDVRVGVLEQAVADCNTISHRIHTSLSWKITWPIRAFFPIVKRLCQKLVKFPKKTTDWIVAIAVLPLIRELQMRPELLRKISNLAKRIKIYNFLLNLYITGEEEWVAIQPDKSFVMLGQRFDPEQWLRDAKSVRRMLSKKAQDISETSVERSKHTFKNDVGVIVSLYRSEAFLPYFLESLKRQTIFTESQIYLGAVQASDFELNLLNQFSSENSNVILEVFDYRAGIYEVWNHGVRQTTSQFLTNMNVDDLRRNDSLELQAQFLKTHKSIDVAYQDVYVSFEANAEWALIEGVGLSTSLPHVSLPMMNLGFNPPHNAPMWRRRVHDEVGLFDETFRSAGDFDLWVKAFIKGCKFLKMGEIHSSYYFNPEGISTTTGGASLDETGRILSVCHQEIENQKLNEFKSPETPNIKKYGLADGVTLDLIDEIDLLPRTNKS